MPCRRCPGCTCPVGDGPGCSCPVGDGPGCTCPVGDGPGCTCPVGDGLSTLLEGEQPLSSPDFKSNTMVHNVQGVLHHLYTDV